jgi:phytoene synthase
VRVSGGAGLIPPLALVADELKRRNRDGWTACLFAPASARPALLALLALDAELAQLVATTSEPLLGEIRLAWWRDRLGELDAGRAPAQPLLQALLAHAVPAGISGAALAGLEDRWLPMIGGDGLPAGHVAGAGLLFRLAARVLGGDGDEADSLGRAWASGTVPAGRTTPPLRPLRGLAKLAAADAAAQAAGRAPAPPGSLPRLWRLAIAVARGR